MTNLGHGTDNCERGSVTRSSIRPLTVSAGYAGGFFQTHFARDGRPDIECHFITFSVDQMGGRLHPFPGFTASSCQLRPKSRGEVRAIAPNPTVPPAILANFLSDPNDCAITVAGLQVLRKIAATEPLRGLIKAEIEPGDRLTTRKPYCPSVGRRARPYTIQVEVAGWAAIRWRWSMSD